MRRTLSESGTSLHIALVLIFGRSWWHTDMQMIAPGNCRGADDPKRPLKQLT
jgi:hypothetical protein